MLPPDEQVLDHGHVKLLDFMGSDSDIANAARISYDNRGKSEDEKLIRYLMRHKHTSPFEMAELKFEIKMPIFVARQWIRHRTANVNEVSARYTQLPAEMYVPEIENIQPQSRSNKQGREGEYDREEAGQIVEAIGCVNHDSYKTYQAFIEISDLARETARGVLPLNTYTTMIWKMDLHNLLHFLKLRTDPHAQEEIREYAEVIEDMVAQLFPITHKAWVDYSKEAYTLSRMEVEMVRMYASILSDMGDAFDIVPNQDDDGMSQREIKEFREKFRV